MQADLLTLLLKLVLLVFLLITSLVPGNSVGRGEKEGWVWSVLQSVSRCQHRGIEVARPAHAAITLANGDVNWFWMAFLSFPKRGFDSHSRSFLLRG